MFRSWLRYRKQMASWTLEGITGTKANSWHPALYSYAHVFKYNYLVCRVVWPNCIFWTTSVTLGERSWNHICHSGRKNLENSFFLCSAAYNVSDSSHSCLNTKGVNYFLKVSASFLCFLRRTREVFLQGDSGIVTPKVLHLSNLLIEIRSRISPCESQSLLQKST